MKKMLTVLLLTVVSAVAYASEPVTDPKFEIMASSTSSLSFTGLGQDKTTSFGFNVGFDYFINKNIEVGLQIQTGIASMLKTVAFMPEVVFNIPLVDEDVRNSFFIIFGIGFVYATADDGAGTSVSDLKAVEGLQFGKRFRLSETVCYNPNISALFYETPTSVSFSISPIAFSFMF